MADSVLSSIHRKIDPTARAGGSSESTALRPSSWRAGYRYPAGRFRRQRKKVKRSTSLSSGWPSAAARLLAEKSDSPLPEPRSTGPVPDTARILSPEPATPVSSIEPWTPLPPSSLRANAAMPPDASFRWPAPPIWVPCCSPFTNMGTGRDLLLNCTYCLRLPQALPHNDFYFLRPRSTPCFNPTPVRRAHREPVSKRAFLVSTTGC